MYAKAERGEIKQFTGLDSPYETPRNPEVRIDGDRTSVAEAVNQLLAWLDEAGVLRAGYTPLQINA